MKEGNTIEIDNPGNWPEPFKIESITEPYIRATILTPKEYVGPIMELCREYRSTSQKLVYLSVGRVEVISEMPLGEVLFDFYGKLKTVMRGYGSFDYATIDYRETDVVKVEILVNSEPVDALAYLPIATKPGSGRCTTASSLPRRFRGINSRSRSRAASAARSSPARRSRPIART